MTSPRANAVHVLGILFAAGLAVRAEAAPEMCTLEAASLVRVGNEATLEGGVLVGDVRGKAHLGRRVQMADGTAVTADLVVLANDSSVFDVVRGSLRRAFDAVVRGEETAGTFPQARDCAIPEIACGGEDVIVGKLGARLLFPGTYGHLVAADGANIAMAPGAYTFCSMRTGQSVALSAGPGAPTSIAVVGDVVLGDATLLQAPPGTELLTLAVGGSRVKLPGGTRVAAYIRSPLARFTIGRTTEFTGGACAERIKLGRNVAFRCAEAAPATTTSTTGPAPTTSTSSTLATTTSTTTTVANTTTTTSSSTSTTTISTTTTVAQTTTTSTSTTPTSTSTTGTVPGTTSSTSTSDTSPATTPSTAETTTSTSTTTSSEAEPTTTSTTSTTGPTTTSTSSTTSTTTTTSTSTTTSPVGCGNGTTSGGETCDDSNNSDNDACPADCRIDACTPLTTTQRFVQVHFQPPAGGLIAGMTLLLDYPEGKVDLPGNGLTFPAGTISGTPPGATIGVNDLNTAGKGHAVRINVTGQSGNPVPPGQVIRFRLQDCSGAVAPTPQQFLCTVISATDPFLNRVDGVQCFVVIE